MPAANASGLLNDYLTRAEAADEIDKNPRTLKRWDDEGIGPPVTYIGRTPYYQHDSLRRWLAGLERGAKQPDSVRRGRPRKVLK